MGVPGCFASCRQNNRTLTKKETLPRYLGESHCLRQKRAHYDNLNLLLTSTDKERVNSACPDFERVLKFAWDPRPNLAHKHIRAWILSRKHSQAIWSPGRQAGSRACGCASSFLAQTWRSAAGKKAPSQESWGFQGLRARCNISI